VSVFASDKQKLTYGLIAAGILLRSVKLIWAKELVAGGLGVFAIAIMFIPGAYMQLPINRRMYFGLVVLCSLFAYSFAYDVGWSKQ